MQQRRGKLVMDTLWSIFLVFALAYGMVVIGMYALQDSLLYRTGTKPIPLSALDLPEMAEVQLQTEDGLSLMAWFAGPRDADGPLVVYFHGNAGTIADRGYKARWFLDQGWGVLLTEYRGFGGNPGKPSEQGFYQDAAAATTHAIEAGLLPGQILLYGESLGTGVAVEEASRLAGQGTPVAGVVLEAPYTSIPAVAQKHYPYLPAKWLVRDRFDSLSKITRIKAPLLVVHGDLDRVIPQSFGKELFAAALEPKVASWLDGIGHNTPFENGGAAAVQQFVENFGK